MNLGFYIAKVFRLGFWNNNVTWVDHANASEASCIDYALS